ncbi:copper homeostasis protein CutC [Roseibium sp.]|uniref:copper homeostasis protein CutC n=1 Tax=Roseibium sp. TaxID=1936156 RepID=UPI003D0CDDA3
MSRLPLEVCVDTIEGAFTAAANGADRIELCAALSEGGLTPSAGFMTACAEVPVPVYAMIRPRGGDFCYSEDEKSLMVRDIEAAEKAGLAGVVIGAVTADYELDATFLSSAIAGTSLPATLHRAFDTLTDLERGVNDAIDLGFERILTSGRATRAELGLTDLAAAVRQSAGRISIMAGSGVTAQNAARILRGTGADELHASCSSRLAVPTPESPDCRLGFVQPNGAKMTDGTLVKSLRTAIDQFMETAA